MPSVGVTGDIRGVVLTLMKELSCEHCQASPLHLQGHEILLLVVFIVVVFVGGDSVVDLRSEVQFAVVASRQTPQAAVFHCCVLERNPKSQQGVGLGVKIGGVLVNIDLSPYLWRLQYRHGLHHQRPSNSHFSTELLYAFSVSDVLEDLVVLMKRVAYLIDGFPFGGVEFPILPSLRLKEEADFISRLKEVFAVPMTALP